MQRYPFRAVVLIIEVVALGIVETHGHPRGQIRRKLVLTFTADKEIQKVDLHRSPYVKQVVAEVEVARVVEMLVVGLDATVGEPQPERPARVDVIAVIKAARPAGLGKKPFRIDVAQIKSASGQYAHFRTLRHHNGRHRNQA